MRLDKLTGKQFRRSTIAEIESTAVSGAGNDMALRLNTDGDYYILQMTYEEAQALHEKLGRWFVLVGNREASQTPLALEAAGRVG